MDQTRHQQEVGAEAKGIILAGGKATRLYPATQAISKQLLPVYDKPMLYYPLTTLIQAGCREIMVITNPEYVHLFHAVLSPLLGLLQESVHIQLVRQDRPAGIAQAITIAADHAFIGRDDRVLLVLGDNIFHGPFQETLRRVVAGNRGASIFLSQVRDPQRYGVVRFDDNNRIEQIREKPTDPPSNWVVTGLYCYDGRAPDFVRGQLPSARGELEITDLNNKYLEFGGLDHCKLPQETAWMDMGTPESLAEASSYVQAVQNRSLSLVGSPEVAALQNGWLEEDVLKKRFSGRKDDYARKLLSLLC